MKIRAICIAGVVMATTLLASTPTASAATQMHEGSCTAADPSSGLVGRWKLGGKVWFSTNSKGQVHMTDALFRVYNLKKKTGGNWSRARADTVSMELRRKRNNKPVVGPVVFHDTQGASWPNANSSNGQTSDGMRIFFSATFRNVRGADDVKCSFHLGSTYPK